MFERYTEKARNVIFHARHFAGELRCRFIEAEHILLAILKEDPGLFRKWINSDQEIDAFRAEIEQSAKGAETSPAGVEMALSSAAKRVLAYAAEESDRLQDSAIRPAHLITGILRERDTPASIALRNRGVDVQQARVVFVSSSDGNAAMHANTEDLHRLVEELPASQLGRARALLVALREANRQS